MDAPALENPARPGHFSELRMSPAKKILKKTILGTIGIGCLILGLYLVLFWWEDVVNLFKGFIGMFLAVLGLFILFVIRE